MSGDVKGVDLKPVSEATFSASGSTREADPAPDTQRGKRGWQAALRHEIRTHKFGYSVLAVALVAGPILLRMIFPSISIVQAIVGGLAFGVYLALCAVPQKFM